MIGFGERLAQAVRAKGAPLCVGLDPHLDRLPRRLRERFEGLAGAAGRRAAADAVVEFNDMVIHGVAEVAVAVKPQLAFYEALGSAGSAALEQTCELARAAGLLVIGDGKRGDIASTAAAYARAILDPEGPLGCDALTVNPWMGPDTLDPFMELVRDAGRGLFVLVRTSNKGSGRFQAVGDPPVAWHVADVVRELGRASVGPSGLSSVGAVVAARVPAEARELRTRMPGAWFLVPGLGAQGGTAEQGVAGARADGLGVLPTASRSVLFPSGGSEQFEVEPGEFARSRARVLASEMARTLISRTD